MVYYPPLFAEKITKEIPSTNKENTSFTLTRPSLCQGCGAAELWFWLQVFGEPWSTKHRSR
jgi:hypothetical protein